MAVKSGDPISTTIFSFQDVAAGRGDGLHPRIAEAFWKCGDASGPPPSAQYKSDNVLEVDFARAAPPQKIAALED